MTPDEQAYVAKHHCKQLTFGGGDELYQTPIGAHTISDAIAISALRAAYLRTPQPVSLWTHVECSAEMMNRHERCVDEHGFGLC